MHTNATTTNPLKLLRGLIPDRTVDPHEHRRIAELQANWLRRVLKVSGPSLDTMSVLTLPRIELRHDASLPTSGMSFWDGHRWVILLNSTEPLTRQRFTLLHELHHIICHTKRGQLFGKPAAKDDAAAERMADYFAACALMPKLYVKRLFGRGVHDTEELANRFEVSELAMKVRLDQLGLANMIEPNTRCGRPSRRDHPTDCRRSNERNRQ